MSQAAASHDTHANDRHAPARTAGPATPVPVPAATLQSLVGNQGVGTLLGGGRPLPDDVRRDFEARYRHSFADVRIHTDAGAAQAAGALNAGAFTAGRDIVFGGQAFEPRHPQSRWLIAHELAHVVQQSRGGVRPPLEGAAPHEADADRAADAAVYGSGPVEVAGATGVGVACGPVDWLRRNVPEKYRDKAMDLAKGAADQVVSTALGPIVPPSLTQGLGSSLVESGVGVAAEHGDALVEKARGEGRDVVLRNLGRLSGVAKQLTEVVDTGMWAGDEFRNVRAKVAEIGGEKGSIGNQLAGGAFDSVVDALPGNMGQVMRNLGDLGDRAKEAGLVDTNVPEGQAPRASLTAPFSRWVNEIGSDVEEAIGGTPSDPLLFSELELGEIEGAIGSQVVLALTGTEEVKVALNVVSALQSVRGIVESIRRNPNGWYGDAQFWGGVIGVALSIVGLKHCRGATKFTTLLMKWGWTAAAVPALIQMKDAYFTEGLTEEERERRVKAAWASAIHVLKDGILHVAQAQGAKPKGAGAGTGEDGGTPPPSKNAGNGDDSGTPPPAKTAAVADGGDGGDAPPKVTSAAAGDDTGSPTTATPASKSDSGLELDTGDGQSWRGREPMDPSPVDLGPAPKGPSLDLDMGDGQPWKGTAPQPLNEVDLGPTPTGPKIPLLKPGQRPPRAQQTFGPESNERSGTHNRTGISFNELNPAEIANGLRVDYDPVAGRPRSVSYRVDKGTGDLTPQTDRTFRRDASTEGAQATTDDYTNTGWDRGHLPQREAFKGDASVEASVDQMTGVVPMHPDVNRGAGSLWRAAESRTIRYADQRGSVNVEVRPEYGPNPQRLPNGTPIPIRVNRRVIAPDGTVLEDLTFTNAAGQGTTVVTNVAPSIP